jgi:EF-hand domain/EF hand
LRQSELINKSAGPLDGRRRCELGLRHLARGSEDGMRKLRVGAGILVLAAVLVASGAPVDARRSTASVFQLVDINRDGTIDEGEVRQAASAFFDRLDTDKDGTLDAKELRGHLSEQDFRAYDTDHDNTLTKDEYLAIVEQRFKSTDANHDGKLKIDELTSAPGAVLVKLITFQIEGIHP